MSVLRASFLILFILLQAGLWFGKGNVFGVLKLTKEIEKQSIKNEALAERNHKLALEIQGYKEGLSVVEKHAREDLGMIKSGEVFYQVIDR